MNNCEHSWIEHYSANMPDGPDSRRCIHCDKVEEYAPRSHSLTLFVFSDHNQAKRSGFKDHRHPLDRELMAWWPGASEGHLYGRGFQKIIIGWNVPLSQHLEEILRSRQMTFKNRIWIEL